MGAVKIPGYTLKKKLGQGGMAAVFLAIQESFQREVALKVMFPGIAKEPGFAERFLGEARTVAKLVHPHIIVVHDVGRANDLHYFAMEYHTGGDLTHRIRQADVTPHEALVITRQMADALAFAHDRQIIHRDIKPDNVLFRAHDGSAILTDFGIAKNMGVDPQLTQLGTTVGTPKYMSPEQARGQPLDGRADIYSLGVMLFEMLTGHPPFMAEDAVSLGIKHCQDAIPRLPGELARYQELIDRMMAKDTAQRLAGGRAVMVEIDALIKPGQRQPMIPASTATTRVVPVASSAGSSAATAATVVTSVLPAGAGKPAAGKPAKGGKPEPFFSTEEITSGGFFSKRYDMKAAFSCEDYDEFRQQLGLLQEELRQWLEKRGKKAKGLHVAVQAHPWIHGRVREVLNRGRSENTPFGAALNQAEVTLHLYDDQDPTGTTIALSAADGKPLPAPATAG
ncbi:MAG: serine/threonine-protein kinase [Moraxellaceae bacterium]|nr:serine/threonine-protein kinase [Moraxellaceae bacterium]